MIRAIIVDDEPLALQHMKLKLIETGHVEVIQTFFNPLAALEEMKKLDFHVAFLDIEMPGLSGLDLAEYIQEWNPSIYIVFATAYRDYAIQAFELHSIDYVLKPIIKDRIDKTITRIRDHILLTAELPVQEIPPSLRIECFREFAVYHQNEPIKWKTAKVKELFAFFIMNYNSPINRDSLIDTLWPETDYQKAKIQLHTSISHLRKTLNALGYPNAITFSNQSYSLQLPAFQCDAHELEQLVDDMPKLEENNVQVVERIIQQYQGDFLELNSYDWSITKAQELRLSILQLLQTMVHYFSNHHEPHKKQHYLQRMCQLNPYSEDGVRQLMQHYIDIGNRAGALAAYHDLKSLLMEDLGILPDALTNELYETVLRSHSNSSPQKVQ
ncbi:putative response regulatory protein [Bacillus sp. OxB-1]|uniref:response regulator n=1 Tax=Bacillus sp. (strain OxB-1) TaxID=98228 RepID=UPI000581E5A5|nr:response regulator [Bacillus sp. OxB-1]BAQ09592.1 putative response regulatory protein [Bacillus sp. OxB-1]